MILCVSSDSLCMCIRMNMIIMICSSDSSAKIRVANFSKISYPQISMPQKTFSLYPQKLVPQTLMSHSLILLGSKNVTSIINLTIRTMHIKKLDYLGGHDLESSI